MIAVAALASSSSSIDYHPIQETDFDRLFNEGCVRKGDRFAATAQINSASRETMVRWNGVDGSRTVAV